MPRCVARHVLETIGSLPSATSELQQVSEPEEEERRATNNHRCHRCSGSTAPRKSQRRFGHVTAETAPAER
ncbi:hypothetical protein CH063_04162 [Colletotrichum higginsianum]|uniref:Uncharacterized protein n=1 Tax=Colletotrichum higginsianum (strain IMI 349063) TaxID=759273 RepID=H1W4N7_COLHI|nr:hypothetical protein CH063_04162 [Colletotrichum higginsianum]